jgi:hypothetical protein
MALVVEFFMLHIFCMINMAVTSTVNVAHKLGQRNIIQQVFSTHGPTIQFMWAAYSFVILYNFV